MRAGLVLFAPYTNNICCTEWTSVTCSKLITALINGCRTSINCTIAEWFISIETRRMLFHQTLTTDDGTNECWNGVICTIR